MSAFLANYPENLRKVSRAISKFSGKNGIDEKKSLAFIEAQTSPIRRAAAKALIDNTVYITLSEVTDSIEKLVLRVYTDEHIGESPKIYVYCGAQQKSSYFMSVLAMFFIRKHGLKEPTFVCEITSEMLSSGNPILILDDAAYSGSQLGNQLNKIYWNHCVVGKNPVPNIHVLLVALNTESEKKLKIIDIDYWLDAKGERVKFKGDYTRKKGKSPFNIIYDRKYETLHELLDEQMRFNVYFMFAFWNQHESPNVCMILDHKLADVVSTFKNTLMYGAVAPSTPDFYEFPDKITENDSYGNNSYRVECYDVFKKADVADRPSDTVVFIPFCSACCADKTVISVIRDPVIAKMSYHEFTFPEKCVRKAIDKSYDKCSITADGDSYTDNYLGLSKAFNEEYEWPKMSKSAIVKLTRLNDRIYSAVCPRTWYKSGPLAMSNAAVRHRSYRSKSSSSKTTNSGRATRGGNNQ